MKTQLTTICFWLIFISAAGQNLELDIHKKTVADFVKIEQSLGSNSYPNRFNHISPGDIAQPVIYTRKETLLPDLLCYYYFNKKDSAIDNIMYEWKDQDSPATRDSTPKTTEQVNGFMTKYKEVYGQIEKIYGPGETKGNWDGKTKFANTEIERTDEWNTKDSTKINLSIYISHKYEKHGSATQYPTYVIRLSVRNKMKPQEALKLEKTRIDSLDNVFRRFIAAMRGSDFDMARACLSDLIKHTATNQSLSEVIKEIRLKEKLILAFTAMQALPDGRSFPMLKYTYESKKGNGPTTIIIVQFDRENKIIAIQPMQRQ